MQCCCNFKGGRKMYTNFRVVIIALSCAAITTQIGAYTYRFENTTNKNVEVSFKLAGIIELRDSLKI